jgi:hypothetical protein
MIEAMKFWFAKALLDFGLFILTIIVIIVISIFLAMLGKPTKKEDENI